MLKITLLYSVSQNALRSWWQQPLEKSWDLQCQNGAMSMSPEKPKAADNITLFMTCQIDVVNKQLVPPFNGNNLFSKTY